MEYELRPVQIGDVCLASRQRQGGVFEAAYPFMDAPQELLDFYEAEGIEDVCFNVEESEGAHVSGLFIAEEPQRRFEAFLSTFWRLARQGEVHRSAPAFAHRIRRPR